MREPIMKAVAFPPKFFWAPFLLGAVNLLFCMTAMVFYMGMAEGNPIMAMPVILIGHIFMIILGSKDAHLSAMMASMGRMHGSVNMVKSKGNKFAP